LVAGADDIKRESDHAYAYGSWHFVDYPFSDGVQCPQGLEGEHNLVWAIRRQREALASPSATVWQKAFALRFLIHLMGDMHQPLHAVGRCSATHPKGDQGGNKFHLDDPQYGNLHKIWDAMGGQYETTIEAWCPYGKWDVCHKNEASRVTAVQTEARRLIAGTPASTLTNFHPSDTQGFEGWAKESFHVATSGVVYGNITENGAITDFYTTRCQSVSRERVLLAGYRLGIVLNAIDWPELTDGDKTSSTSITASVTVWLCAVAGVVGLMFGCCISEGRHHTHDPIESQAPQIWEKVGPSDEGVELTVHHGSAGP